MRFFAFLLVFFMVGLLSAQTDTMPSVALDTSLNDNEVELKVGDTMEIGKSTIADHFEYLDYFKKTRWAGNEKSYDTASGQGFYESFFTTGDFDVFELPADYAGKQFVILGMEMLVNKNTGEDMGVLYLRGPEPNTIIWVDFTPAMDKCELKIPNADCK